ncbi:restriction endonuclease subunit S [Candidatus Peregrinibacteria bacterium]|jgi:type I restriction enzyme, S subunit|nr:restriction endonuclease subunit S [Candidatus Peregrinibacteria bacterium]MBT7736339.1 restriction endonuclease subunit S [Candidatus Peregrinibacteria bacterium]
MTVQTQTIPEGYKQTETGVIPVDWDVKKLDDLVHFNNGKAHEQFITQNGNYIVINSKFISTEGAIFKTSGKNLSPLSDGEITMVMSDIPNGKALAKCFFIRKNDKYTLNQRICSFKSKSADSEYLFYKLNRNKYFLDFDSGVGQTNLKRSDVLNCPVVIPTKKEEQTAIATALSNTDELIEKLEKLIDKKKAIKQGAMQELLTGKRRLPGFSEEWEPVKLGDLNSIEFSKGQGLPKSELSESGKYNCVHYGELFTRYAEKIETVVRYTNFDGAIKSRKNDILMPTSDVTPNGLATASCILLDGAVLGGDILIIRAPKSTLNGVFFSYGVHINRSQVMSLVSGSTVYHLYAGDMKNYEFLLPSIEEQNAIATILSDMDTEIEKLEQKLSKLRRIKTGMMQQLLTGKIRIYEPN